MLQRHVPQRTKVQGSPAFQGFGSGCKRFDPKVMIINWTLEHDAAAGSGWRPVSEKLSVCLENPLDCRKGQRYERGARSTVEGVLETNAAPAAGSDSAARRTPEGQENELLAHFSPHADQASLSVGDGFGSGERLRISHSRKRTPLAAMSYDGVSAEHHAISAMDLAALQLRGEMQYTPVERRQLHSGGICGWDAGSPATNPAMADVRQTQRERSTGRQAAERPGPAPSTARHTHTANPVQQVC